MSPGPFRETTADVLYCEAEIPLLDAVDVARLGALAAASPRRRARICAHAGPGDALHQMVIAMTAGGYVRPHRHLARAESFHVVTGRATVLLFDDDGTPRARLPLGDLASGRPFFFRIPGPVYHSLIVEDGPFVFHEVTTGPFDPATTQGAPWAPEEREAGAGRALLEAALQRLQETP